MTSVGYNFLCGRPHGAESPSSASVHLSLNPLRVHVINGWPFSQMTSNLKSLRSRVASSFTLAHRRTPSGMGCDRFRTDRQTDVGILHVADGRPLLVAACWQRNIACWWRDVHIHLLVVLAFQLVDGVPRASD